MRGFPGFMGIRSSPGRSGDQGIEGDPLDGGINSPGKDMIMYLILRSVHVFTKKMYQLDLPITIGTFYG